MDVTLPETARETAAAPRQADTCRALCAVRCALCAGLGKAATVTHTGGWLVARETQGNRPQ